MKAAAGLLLVLAGSVSAQTLTVDGRPVELPATAGPRQVTCPMARPGAPQAIGMQLPEPPPELRAKVEAAKARMELERERATGNDDGSKPE